MPNELRTITTTSTDGPEPDETLDLRGLKCPLPVLRTRRALMRLMPGAKLDVLCTDPLAALDMPNLLRQTGDILLASTGRDGEMRFSILKTGTAAEGEVLIVEDPSATASVDKTQ